MKAVRPVDGHAAVVEVPEPSGERELLAMAATSVCASDFLYMRVGCTKVLGHELAGTRTDGTPVVVEGVWGCMSCDQCRAGRYNLCPTHPERALGVSIDGGMSEWFRAPAERLVPLPDGLALADAPIVEPAAVSWHALRLGNTGPDTTVAVVGAGALGLLAVAGARRMGAEVVDLEARHPHQRLAGERLGAGIGPTGSYDVVIEAAGSMESLARAAELVAPGGSIVVLGVHLGAVELPWMPLFNREARIIPSLGYCVDRDGRREMENAALMLADDPDIAATLITHRFAIDDAAEAFRVAADRAAGALRVVIEP